MGSPLPTPACPFRSTQLLWAQFNCIACEYSRFWLDELRQVLLQTDSSSLQRVCLYIQFKYLLHMSAYLMCNGCYFERIVRRRGRMDMPLMS